MLSNYLIQVSITIHKRFTIEIKRVHHRKRQARMKNKIVAVGHPNIAISFWVISWFLNSEVRYRYVSFTNWGRIEKIQGPTN